MNTILNFDKLLQPIEKTNLVGRDIQNDPAISDVYYKLRDLRSAARLKERKKMQEGNQDIINPTDWKELMSLSCTVLQKQSKNLEVACWLCEALVRIYGFAGLRDGFHLLRELLLQFWPAIYPVEDEEGLSTKLATLSGLNGEDAIGTLIVPIQCVPLTNSDVSFGYWQYQQATATAQVTDAKKREQRIQDGAVTLERIDQSVTETAIDYLTDLSQDLQGCQAAFTALCQMLEKTCQEAAPPTSNIKKSLTYCATALQAFIDKKQTNAAQKDAEIEQTSAVGQDNNMGRTKALSKLLEIARYFREAEPHSPISYLLERTVKWGKMSLEELVQEIFLDPNAQYGYCKMVGIEPAVVVQESTPNQGGAPNERSAW